MLLLSFNYADLQLFSLNEWFLIKLEHLQVLTTKEGANETFQQGNHPQVYSVCQPQSAVTNPLTQIPINQQWDNVFINVRSYMREQL